MKLQGSTMPLNERVMTGTGIVSNETDQGKFTRSGNQMAKSTST